MELTLLEQVLKRFEGIHLVMEGGSRKVFDGTSQEIDSTENAIFRGDSWLGDIGVAELSCVRVEGGLGLFINKMIAAILVEGRTNIETLARAELPLFAVVGIGVDEKLTT